MNDDLVEKVARAMVSAHELSCGPPPSDIDDFLLMAPHVIAAMSEWQPIETAPKDGTEIIIWDGSSIFIATYVFTDDTGKMKWFPSGMPFVVATHWMPLPSPPLPEREGKV